MPYFRTSDGCHIYYEKQGQGAPLILIHGWSASHDYFSRQIQDFCHSFTVISYDLRGHGKSAVTEQHLTLSRFARDLQELLCHLHIEKVSLLGWSMGVHVIFEFIRQFGCQQLEKLVLVDMTPKMVTDAEWPYGLHGQYPLSEGVKAVSLMYEDWNKTCEFMVPGLFAPDFSDTGAIRRQTELAKCNHVPVMAAMWLALLTADYRDIMDDITVPVFLAYGKAANFFPVTVSKWLQLRIAHSVRQGFSGGHMLFYEDTPRFNESVLKFLKS